MEALRDIFLLKFYKKAPEGIVAFSTNKFLYLLTFSLNGI